MMFEEKLSDADLIAAVRICCGPVEYTSCDECPAHEWCEETHTDIMYELERRLSDLRSCLEDAKNGRLEMARKYQTLKNERDDLRKEVAAQGEIILELNRDLKRSREALNAQGEYAYLGGDLISREALIERAELIHWYSTNDKGVLSSGAANEESAYVRYTDVAAVIEGALAVEAEPVVHARWRWGRNSMNQYGAWCTECECGWEDKGDSFDRVQGLVIAHKYCPNCGAHMDEEVNNETD
jgi:hypothetical protein